MTIRNKILIYFSASTILLVGIAFFLIYMLFYAYREEEFQQRQKEKVTTSLGFLEHIKATETALIGKLNTLDINNMLDEKLLIFNKNKRLIYSSIDDTPVLFSNMLLQLLSKKHPWEKRMDGNYDVIGMYIESNGQAYYGISKAYDAFGYSKLHFLRNVLLITYLSIIIAVVLISMYLSKRISSPIADVTKLIKNYDLDAQYVPITALKGNTEVATLVEQFNKLMKRTNDAFEFQKHAIHHISHELKTPITILVSNFERMEKETNVQELQKLITMQKEDTKNLSEIINALLEIAKAETDGGIKTACVRIDELIFDLAEELNIVYPQFLFSIVYEQDDEDTSWEVNVNIRLFKAALLNLMHNCVQYSSNNKALITLVCKNNQLQIAFENDGAIIEPQEIPFLFQHFFRGANSKGKRGFGLGLVFIDKIMKLHHGKITYCTPDGQKNRFLICF